MRRRTIPKRDLDRLAKKGWGTFRQLSRPKQAGLIALGVLGLAVYWFVQAAPAPPVAPNADPLTGLNPDGSGTFQFCFWNVENLFDDKDDRRREVDEVYDDAFAQNPALRQKKLDQLATVLLKMNGGKGPDILAVAEVESVRAADLLRATLNRKLTEAKADPKLIYTQVAMKNVDGGRHIAPGIITRLNVLHVNTQLHGRLLRILETRLFVNGYPLTIVSSHWTSQLRQRDGTSGESGRERYAGTIRDVFDEMVRKDPTVDFLVCGDFNAVPQSDEIRNVLGTTPDPRRWLGADRRPLMWNLFDNKPPDRYGTIWYSGQPLIYDQICISYGLTDDKGWGCDPESARTVTEGLIRPGSTRREPWRFGDPQNEPVGGRGYSDHFPVTVTLTVRPPADALPKPE